MIYRCRARPRRRQLLELAAVLVVDPILAPGLAAINELELATVQRVKRVGDAKRGRTVRTPCS
jgi:hypothetical protein